MSRDADADRGVRYHEPRRRAPLPVLAVGAVLVGALVAGQLATAGADDDSSTALAGTPAPASTEPSSTGPSSTGPSSPEPAQPESASPEPAQPEPASPEPAQPESSSPEPVEPEPAQPESSSPEPAQPESSSPEPVEPEPSEPEPSEPEPSSPGPAGGLSAELLYDVGEQAPTSGAAAVLDRIAVALLEDPDATVRVVGHAGQSNDPVLEQQLSLQRALGVVDLLVRRGVPTSRVQVVAAGASEADGSPPADNRRVTLEVQAG